MAKVFLDTNIYIDLIERAQEKWEGLRANLLYISPLSTHILFYTSKRNVPDPEVDELQKQFGIIPLTEGIFYNAMIGPTSDLEDNIQLHSAVETECDIFLTNDKQLLKMKFFGKTQILPEIPKSR